MRQRAEISKTKRTLRTIEMRRLKVIRGITRRDKVRNEEIRKDCNIQDILRWIRVTLRMVGP